MNPALTVLAPVFTDETASLRYAADVLAASARAAAGESYEILFADDGSGPAARDLLRRLAAENPRIRLVGDGKHHGLGTMVRWGIRESAGDYILYTDGDGQVSCRELALVWPDRDRFDLTIGYRTGRREGFLRHFGTAILAAASAGVLGKNVRDVDCAFKLARADFLRSLGLRCRGTGIDAEMILMAARRGARIREIPVAHDRPTDRRSRVTTGRVLFGTLEFLAVSACPPGAPAREGSGAGV